MKKTSLPGNMVELEDAVNRIGRWRNGSGMNSRTKAFFISREDIEALYNELNLLGEDYIGVRAYLGTRDDEQENVMVEVDELLMVAVVKDSENPENLNGIDVCVVEGSSESRIYDLTSPCPRMCDERSPLYHLKSKWRKPKN